MKEAAGPLAACRTRDGRAAEEGFLVTVLSLPEKDEGASPPSMEVGAIHTGYMLPIRCEEESIPFPHPPQSL